MTDIVNGSPENYNSYRHGGEWFECSKDGDLIRTAYSFIRDISQLHCLVPCSPMSAKFIHCPFPGGWHPTCQWKTGNIAENNHGIEEYIERQFQTFHSAYAQMWESHHIDGVSETRGQFEQQSDDG